MPDQHQFSGMTLIGRFDDVTNEKERLKNEEGGEGKTNTGNYI